MQQTYFYPDAFSHERMVFTICKDIDATYKAMCGCGSEVNITAVLIKDDSCVYYMKETDIVTSRLWSDGNLLNADIIYSKFNET